MGNRPHCVSIPVLPGRGARVRAQCSGSGGTGAVLGDGRGAWVRSWCAETGVVLGVRAWCVGTGAVLGTGVDTAPRALSPRWPGGRAAPILPAVPGWTLLHEARELKAPRVASHLGAVI